ncbi:unknown protein [Desulfotalea psychrophila LSv54]|uniref:Uncharacterized protein n=1 Tax=Desulfotalea psychrophila (strain LSv54 / DSM 12343) TaxID=177439 RepID=Q6AJW4_DESPS|nr:unknown protein [Desulfotalea psychrophila LSv54]
MRNFFFYNNKGPSCSFARFNSHSLYQRYLSPRSARSTLFFLSAQKKSSLEKAPKLQIKLKKRIGTISKK